jgi:hypothetical protein
LALQALVALEVASDGGADLRNHGLGQGEDPGLASLAIRESGGGVSFALQAAAVGLAAFAAQANEGAAEHGGHRWEFHNSWPYLLAFTLTDIGKGN